MFKPSITFKENLDSRQEGIPNKDWRQDNGMSSIELRDLLSLAEHNLQDNLSKFHRSTLSTNRSMEVGNEGILRELGGKELEELANRVTEKFKELSDIDIDWIGVSPLSSDPKKDYQLPIVYDNTTEGGHANSDCFVVGNMVGYANFKNYLQSLRYTVHEHSATSVLTHEHMHFTHYEAMQWHENRAYEQNAKEHPTFILLTEALAFVSMADFDGQNHNYLEGRFIQHHNVRAETISSGKVKESELSGVVLPVIRRIEILNALGLDTAYVARNIDHYLNYSLLPIPSDQDFDYYKELESLRVALENMISDRLKAQTPSEFGLPETCVDFKGLDDNMIEELLARFDTRSILRNTLIKNIILEEGIKYLQEISQDEKARFLELERDANSMSIDGIYILSTSDSIPLGGTNNSRPAIYFSITKFSSPEKRSIENFSTDGEKKSVVFPEFGQLRLIGIAHDTFDETTTITPTAILNEQIDHLARAFALELPKDVRASFLNLYIKGEVLPCHPTLANTIDYRLQRSLAYILLMDEVLKGKLTEDRANVAMTEVDNKLAVLEKANALKRLKLLEPSQWF